MGDAGEDDGRARKSRRDRGYIRAAERSLGLVIDAPPLDTQRPFDAQVAPAENGLNAAGRLANLWDYHAHTLAP